MNDVPGENGEVEIPLRFTGLEEGKSSADAIFNALSRNAEKFQEKLDAFKRQFNDIARLTDPSIAMNAAAGAIGMSTGQRLGVSAGGPGDRQNFGNFGNIVGGAIERSIKQATGGYTPSLHATPGATVQQLLNQSLHPKMELPFGSMGKLQYETEGLAGMFHRLSTAGDNLGEGIAGASKRIASSSMELFNVLRQSAFGRSLGLKAMGPDGKLQALTPDSFARALGRFMAARSLGGFINAGFEAAKNPLHDNYQINTAQRATNNVINTLATTGSPLAAALSGVSSLLMSSIERRNALHTQQYNFDQRNLDTSRTFAQRRSDWSFEQILNQMSRGEQIKMLRARADQIGGVVTEASKADDVASTTIIEERKRARAEKLLAAERQITQEIEKRVKVQEKSAEKDEQTANALRTGSSLIGSRAVGALGSVAPNVKLSGRTAEAIRKENEELQKVLNAPKKEGPTFFQGLFSSSEALRKMQKEKVDDERARKDAKEKIKQNNLELGALSVASATKHGPRKEEEKQAGPLAARMSPNEILNATVISEKARKAQEEYQQAMAERQRMESLTIGGFYGNLAQRRNALRAADDQKNIGDIVNASDYDTNATMFGKHRVYNTDVNNVAKALGIDIDWNTNRPTRAISVKELRRIAEEGSDNDENGEYQESAKSLLYWRSKKDNKAFINQVRRGRFKDTDLASLKEALDIAKEEGINPDQDKDFQKIQEMYTSQYRRREEYKFREFQSKYDPSQIDAQYVGGAQVNDTMSRQGFFVGSQVDVQTVNEKIYDEAHAIRQILQEERRREVRNTEIGINASSVFR